MVMPPYTVVSWGHFTRFPGPGNYPQPGGTRPHPKKSAYELVASFSNRSNLLKYRDKTHICASREPIERTSKTCGDHAHSVLRSSPAGYAFFWRHQSRMPV